jgi:hypothetical protein
MTHILTKTVLAAAIGLGSLAMAPAAALADGFYFGIESGGGPRHHFDNDRPMGPPRDDFYGRPHRRPPPPMGGCSDREALRQAWRMGLDQPEVVRVTPRSVVVEGEGRHHRIVQMRFANFPGCPPM